MATVVLSLVHVGLQVKDKKHFAHGYISFYFTFPVVLIGIGTMDTRGIYLGTINQQVVKFMALCS